ncbi:anti-sigma factor family protein [Pontiella sulfatireligans]|uniref:Zinc-finger domain-containing protein n=1 Tax=Pontiella sulfatireligans TaxID=2750658 RepID=A0A6C2UGX1_9BACT|nr:hypothetical protein [Pontiella sulfatireligans]VGO19435.1 hypothetical protein SCARR_01493 [Pontiella sulfatireligans]
MKCTEAEKWVLLQDSGEIPAKRKNALAAHLHDCNPCRQFQHALIESQQLFPTTEEPGAKALQNVLREARLQAPERKRVQLFNWNWKPALAMAASVLIGLGFFSLTLRPDRVGLELVVTEMQMMDAEDQIVDVMYSGLSEDNLAFNFLMSYEGG